MEQRVKFLIESLELLPHPEGGYYKEVYRSNSSIKKEALPEGFTSDRVFCTSIYFLITEDNFSAFHRLKQDEIWHFYEGDILNVHEITPSGEYNCHRLGLEIEKGVCPQLIIGAGAWFGSNIEASSGYSLVGCTVAPGFEFEDFEMAERHSLLAQYPEHRAIISSLTRV